MTQLKGADLRKASVYGTRFQDAELSFADLRSLRSLPVGWEGPSESESPSSEPDWKPFSGIEKLEARLEQEGKHWSEEGRRRVERAIDRFWSIAFDLPVQLTATSPLQGFDMIYDWRGPFATWPAPPEGAKLERIRQMRADYRAGLACDDRYIAERMWRDAKKTQWNKGDPVLKQALQTKAESGDCSVLAEVLEKLSKKGP